MAKAVKESKYARKQARKKERKREALAFIESIQWPSIVAYTDGGSSPNPGPAGSGVFLSIPTCFCTEKERQTIKEKSGHLQFEYSIPLGKGTNNIAELTAVGFALKLLCARKSAILQAKETCRSIEIMTDSNYVKGLLIDNYMAHTNEQLVNQVRGWLKRAQRTFAPTRVRVNWIPAHCGIEGNERADSLATVAMNVSKTQISKEKERK